MLLGVLDTHNELQRSYNERVLQATCTMCCTHLSSHLQ